MIINYKGFVLGWWSAGVTSAVACYFALKMYSNVKLYYIDIDTCHPDNKRFKSDCENWYNQEIHTIKSSQFNNQFDVIEKTGAVNTPFGAPCTSLLKKKVRTDFEDLHSLTLFNDEIITNQVWGYEYKKSEVNRAIRHAQQYPNSNPLFPLIEKGIDKNSCAGLLLSKNIELPEMYKLGFTNNNCIGCVKGGKGYWNKIRVTFPETFKRMALLERKVGYSCINGCFLDQLNPNDGKMSDEVMPNCGLLCEVEFADIPDKNLDLVMSEKNCSYALQQNRM